MIADDELLTRIGNAVLSGVRLVHEANLTVLGAIGDSLPVLPLVDIVPAVPRLLEHSFRFVSQLLEVQRHYTLEYLAVLGAPEPPEHGAAA